MNRQPLRRLLVWCVVGILLGPALIAVVAGLGALLRALGDAAAAAVCGRIALALGVIVLVTVMATTAVNAMLLLAGPPVRRGGRRRWRRRRLRVRDAGQGPPAAV